MSGLTVETKFDRVPGGFYRLNDGNTIPMIGLGISRIVGQESLNVAVRAALEAGYRLFDTAHIYENEAELGNALEKYLPEFGLKRENIFITTKVPTMNSDPENETRRLIQESLFKLKTDYLDLVLIHYPRDRHNGKDNDHETNARGRKAVWEVLEKYKEHGIARSIGVSNFMNYHLSELEKYAKVLPAVNQIEYQPYLTQDLIRHQCNQLNIFVQAFSSLCWANNDILTEPAVQILAHKYSATPQTILYAFALNTGVGIIPKSATPERICSNLHETAKIRMDVEEVNSLLALDKNTAFCPRCDPWKCL